MVVVFLGLWHLMLNLSQEKLVTPLLPGMEVFISLDLSNTDYYGIIIIILSIYSGIGNVPT